MSSPYLVMYCRCSISLSRTACLAYAALAPELGQAVDHVRHQMEPVEVVHDRHVERRADRPFFLVAAHVQVLVVGAAVGQPVDQPGVAVVGEDDRLVLGEERVEVVVAQAVRVLGWRLEPHQVDDVDHADLQLREVLAQDAPRPASPASARRRRRP